MTYQAYVNKIQRIAVVVDRIRKRKVPILLTFFALMLLTGAFLFTQGMIIGDTNCDDSIVYGQSLSYDTPVLFGKAKYEFTEAGEDDWSEDVPYMPGEYQMRAVSKRFFGRIDYSETLTFTIEKLVTDLSAKETSIIYGDQPSAKLTLARGDRVKKITYEYGQYYVIGQTNVLPVADSIRIVDREDRDVTEAYELHILETTVDILPRPLTVRLEGAEKIYDGTPLSQTAWEIISGSLADEDELTVTADSYLIDVGICENEASISLYNQTLGRPIDHCYQLTVETGDLIITPRPITILTGSDQKIYDDLPLSVKTYEVTSELGFVSGHRLTVTESSTLVNVDRVENEFVGYTITDSDGQEQTGNYDLTFEEGILEITPRPVKLETLSAEKKYDGIPLSCTDYRVLTDSENGFYSLIQGHEIIVLSSAEVKNVSDGLVENTFDSVDIYDQSKESVLDNYKLSYVTGTLSLTPRVISVNSHDSEKIYDDQPLIQTDFDVSGDGLAEGQMAYVPEGSSASILEVKESGTANEFFDFEILDREGNSAIENYQISYSWGILTVHPRQISLQVLDLEPVYNGESQTSQAYELLNTSLNDLVYGHELRILESTAKTNAGTYVNEVTDFEILSSDDRDITENYSVEWYKGTLTIQKRLVAVIPEGARKVYDDQFMSNKNYTVLLDDQAYVYDFVLDHVLQVHDSLEIRYVSESAPNQFYSYDVVASDSGEIVSANYVIGVITEQASELIIDPRPILVETNSAEKVYDDMPLAAEGYRIMTGEGFYDLVTGHYVSDDKAPSFVDAGVYENRLSAFHIKSDDDRTVTDNYAITYRNGTITIKKRPIKITTGSAVAIYDGSFLKNDKNYNIVWNGGSPQREPLVSGHSFKVIESAELRDAGEIPNEFLKVAITRSSDQSDKTHNYDIMYECGTLLVKPREITVTTGSDEKIYDGTPLNCLKFKISGRGLAPNETFVPQKTTTVTDASKLDDHGDPIAVDNVFETYVIRNAAGDDVKLSNYVITFKHGSLIVYQRAVTLWIEGSKIYDGNTINADDMEILDLENPHPLVEGHHAVCVPDIDKTDAGEWRFSVKSLSILDENDQEVTANYLITKRLGVISILPAPISITSSAEKYYDGTPLTTSEAQHEGFLHEDHEIRLVTQGSQTEVGVSENVIVSAGIYDKNTNRNVSGNYDMSITNGKLEIKDTILIIRSDSASKEYDGYPLEHHSYELDGYMLPENYTLNVTFTGSQTEIGRSDNTFVYRIFDENGVDVTEHMKVECEYGELVVTKPRGTEIIGGPGGFTVRMYSQDGGSYYVRTGYYGDYNGHGFEASPRYFKGIINPMMLTGKALENSGYSGHIIKFEGGPYMVYNIIDGLSPISDIPSMMSGDIYTYEVIRGGALTAELPDDLKAAEEAYREFVYDTYLQIPDDTKTVLTNLAAIAGLDPEDPEIIEKVRLFISTAATYDLEYAAFDGGDDIVITFLTEVKRGVCVHFASAATMMYRALGIPARYVSGGVPTAVKGEWADIPVQGHAWTEVYVAGLGWIAVDATGSGLGPAFDGEPSILPKEKITIVPHEIKVTFDGNLHGPEGNEYYLDGTPLPEGYTITDVVFSDPRWKVGVYEAYVKDCRVLDENGQDVTNEFTLDFAKVPLEISPCPIVIRTSDAKRYYNGLPLTANEEDDWWISEGILPEGFTVDVTISGSITKVGEVPNEISSVKIYDTEERDVSEFFDIKYEFGMLIVERYNG